METPKGIQQVNGTVVMCMKGNQLLRGFDAHQGWMFDGEGYDWADENSYNDNEADDNDYDNTEYDNNDNYDS